MSLNDFLVRKFIKDSGNTTDQNVRAAYGFLEAWVSIVGNIVVAAFKYVVGVWLNSISLIADAIHTASDVLTSVVVLIGFRAARAPADEKHPYGHGRVEAIATLIIAFLLVMVGLSFGKASIDRLLSGTPVRGNWLVAAILMLTALFKEWMARFSIDLGKRINSSTLVADAWHHRSDAIATAMVIIAIGASALGYYRADAIFGLAVSALIVYTGASLGLGTASTLIGEQPDPAVVERISSIAAAVPEVQSVHSVSVHDYGAGRMEVSLHILVDRDLSVHRGHEIAAAVKYAVHEQTGILPVIHVEPDEPERRPLRS